MRRFLPLALLLLVSPAAFGQELAPERAAILDRVGSALKTSAFVPGIDLSRWDAVVAESRGRLAAAKTDDEFAREVNADLRKFGASHFRFMTPRQDETRRTQRTVGLGIAGTPAKDGLRVAAVVPGSPADKANLKAGDVVEKIDGKLPTREALYGKAGKTAVLLVRGRKKPVTVGFAPYSLRRPATLTRIDPNTALFRLPTFSTGYDRDEVERCIAGAKRYPSLIVDVRDNGGGAVVNMQHLMGLFMPADAPFGTFVTKPLARAYAADRKDALPDPVAIARWSRYVKPWSARQMAPSPREGGPLYTGNVAVLVNRGSASASEIFASAMHDVVGADIVGARSMGAVLVSVFRPVGGGFSLQFPTSDYVTVRDRRLEANPLVPVVEDPDAEAEVVKATYVLRRAQLRKERFGG